MSNETIVSNEDDTAIVSTGETKMNKNVEKVCSGWQIRH